MKKKQLLIKRVISVMLLLSVMVLNSIGIVAFAANSYIEISKQGWTKYCSMDFPQEDSTGDKLYDGNLGFPYWQGSRSPEVGDYFGVKLPKPQRVSKAVVVANPYTPSLVGVYVTNDFEEWTRVAEYKFTSSVETEVEIYFTPMEITGIKFQAEEIVPYGWWSVAEVTLYNDPNAPAFDYKDIEGSIYENEINVLSVLDLVPGISYFEYGVDSYVTRAEFAEWMLNYADIPISSYEGETVYLDVSPEHWAYNTIYTCYAAGIIRANGMNAKFRPDDNITYGEAVSMLIGLLGYSQIAEDKGGYPTGYFAAATGAGMLKGITAERDDVLTKGELSKLLYNSLDVNPMKSFNLSKDGYEIRESEVTMLEELDVKKARGIVQANDVTMLNNSSYSGAGIVVIDGVEFNEGKTNASDLLGYMTEYLYKEDDGRRTIIYIKPLESGNKTVKINSDDIAAGTTLSVIRYYDENQKERSASLSDRCCIIFNGVANSNITAEDIKSVNGSLELIDNNDDGVVDVLKVEDYITYVVMTASTFDRTIFDQHSNRFVDLKNLDDDRINVIDCATGQGKKFSSINEGDILSIYPDRMKTDNGERIVDNDNLSYITIYVSTERVIGEISKKTQKNGKTYFTINDNEYVLSECIKSKSAELKIGKEYLFSLDHMGRIADFNLSDGKNKYGLLMGVKKESELSNELIVKIFTQNGRAELYTIHKKAKFGTQSLNIDAIQAALSDFLAKCSTDPSLVVYNANESGVIKFINVANNIADVVLESERTDTELQLAYSGTCKFANGYFGNEFFSDSATVCFAITSDSDDNLKLSDETALRKRSATSGFRWQYGYKTFAYNLDNNYVADVVCIVETDTGGYDTADRMLVFDEVYKLYDAEEGEIRQVITGIYNGKEKEYLVSKNNVYDFHSLSTGDVGFCLTDSNGEVVGFNRIFNSNRNWEKAAAINVSPEEVVNEMRYVAGKVVRRDGGYVIVDVSKTSENTTYDGSIKEIFKDINSICIKEDDKLWISNVSEISVGDYIFIRNCEGKPYDVVVYK